MKTGLEKSNLTSFFISLTKGSLGLFMESMFTPKEVLVTTSMP